MGSMELLIKMSKNYLIKMDKNGNNYCNYPKEVVYPRKIRGFGRVYYQYNKKIKKICYDKSLWLDEVLVTDPIENDLIYIKNNWPNWYYIEVLKY